MKTICQFTVSIKGLHTLVKIRPRSFQEEAVLKCALSAFRFYYSLWARHVGPLCVQPSSDPQVLNQIQVWAPARPFENFNLYLVKPLFCWFGWMLWVIAMLEYEVHILLQLCIVLQMCTVVFVPNILVGQKARPWFHQTFSTFLTCLSETSCVFVKI